MEKRLSTWCGWKWQWLCALLVTGFLGSATQGGYYFVDEFTTFDPSVWDFRSHGYPAPAKQVAGGKLWLGNPFAYTLDFPVMYSRVPIFPPTGDYSLEIGFQYPSLRTNGVGFRALTAGPPYYAVLQFWQAWHPLVIDFGDQRRVFPPDMQYHIIRFDFVGSTVTAYLDGTLLGTGNLPHGRPSVLYFGHPRPGEAFGIPGFVPAYVDSNGILRRRWWGAWWWTNLMLDFVRVRQISPIPEPSSALLLGLGVVGAAWFRRRSTG